MLRSHELFWTFFSKMKQIFWKSFTTDQKQDKFFLISFTSLPKIDHNNMLTKHFHQVDKLEETVWVLFQANSLAYIWLFCPS